ncbi:MAG: hypothetical protein PVH61_41340 [Candidatus Aminicenantes bacterium]|jgi:rubredoxin
MEINFECRKCKNLFDCDVGEVTLPENALRPDFEKHIICPTCGIRTMDEVFLTELGQSQLTQATLDIEGIDLFDIEDIDSFDIEDDELSDYGFYEGECQACDSFESLNDMGLCRECDAKLDRDLIRERDWAYSVSAFGVPESKLEELREEVIKQYGEKLELIAPTKSTPKKSKKRKRKKKKSSKRH